MGPGEVEVDVPQRQVRHAAMLLAPLLISDRSNCSEIGTTQLYLSKASANNSGP